MENNAIRTSLIKIGNSQGVRLPKTLLAMSGIENDVEIAVIDGTITIRAAKKAREGWAESFQAMAVAGDDQLIDPPIPSEWDEAEWEWE